MRPTLFATFISAALFAAACQSTPRSTGAGADSGLADTAPITADSATLTVGGLGCPLCASNIENKLSGIDGVEGVSVDLAEGLVTVKLWGPYRPSPAKLAKAVRDSGFKPTRIETH